MKIIYFIESLESGGKERRLVELLKGIKRNRNFECELVVTKEAIHYSDIYSTGIPINYIERKSKKDLSPFLKFLRICRRYKPDIIHVWGNLVALYAIPSKLLLRIPMINSQIADAPQVVKYGILINTFPLYFSDVLIANSKAGLQAYNISSNRGVVIYNGFDAKRMNAIQNESVIKAKFGINGEYVVGMVANFTIMKDYKTFIEAASIVLKEIKNVVFMCIGSGDYEEYKRMIPAEYCGNFIFPGPQGNVESIVNTFTIGVLSTYTEGISNSVLEYMASGKPVIVTDGGGSNELVIDNESGYLIPARSPGILAEKIIYLLKNAAIRQRFGDKGKEIVRTTFDMNVMIEKYISEYNKIAGK